MFAKGRFTTSAIDTSLGPRRSRAMPYATASVASSLPKPHLAQHHLRAHILLRRPLLVVRDEVVRVVLQVVITTSAFRPLIHKRTMTHVVARVARALRLAGELREIPGDVRRVLAREDSLLVTGEASERGSSGGLELRGVKELDCALAAGALVDVAEGVVSFLLPLRPWDSPLTRTQA